MTKLPSFPCSDSIEHTLSLFIVSTCTYFSARPINSSVPNHLMLKISSFSDSLVTLDVLKTEGYIS